MKRKSMEMIDLIDKFVAIQHSLKSEAPTEFVRDFYHTVD
jgi:hypothetical protein